LPVIVSVPIGFVGLPGARVAPLLIVVTPGGSTTPVPDNVAPAFTVALAELAIVPSTSSVPAFTTVLPV
jgi:hypothetical protein